LREGIRGRKPNSEELSEDASIKSMDGSDQRDQRKPFQFEQPDYDRTEAPKDAMRKYWRQFETTPIVRKPITSFASRVTEPGYYIESKELSEDEVESLGKWLDQAAILEGQPGRDFRLLAKKAVIQREVRGTALIEVAPDRSDENRIAGLKLINPETMEAITRPNQSILMAPDDLERYEDAPVAESGGAAAWLQDVLETDQTHFGTPIKSDEDTGDMKIGFRRDEIIPLTRDADVGEVFGTSRIESVSDRIDGIRQKLADNDEAIASKAYPLWLFMFGSEDEPWDSSDISEFMSAHEMENFHPGMKQGVRGDVSVETISGEVADIAEYLEFDLRWVMSAMPMPMFVLGAFGGMSTSMTGQVSGVAQQRDINRQIKEARREIEEEFTPVLRDVAKQQGISEEAAKDITLRLGDPEGTDLDPDRSEQVIRYVSDSKGGQTTKTGGGRSDGGGDNVITKGETPSTIDNPTPDQKIAGVEKDGNPHVDTKTGPADGSGESEASAARWNVWETTRSSSQLTDEDSLEADVGKLAYSVFTQARDRTLNQVEERYGATPKYAVAEFENIANRELTRAMREQNVEREVRTRLDDEMGALIDSLGGEVNPFTSDQNTRFYAQNMCNAIRDATEEMLRKARLQIRRGVVDGASWGEVRSRVEQDYNNDYLKDRANLIGQMETKNAIESTKLSEFEKSDEIVGFRVTNNGPSTALTQELDGVSVRFDETDDIRETLLEHVSTEPAQGFDPLPTTPPYHFRDTTTLEPIYK
jgi:hypothetical protein